MLTTHAKELNYVLHNFGLTQYVQQPTHNSDTLNLIIGKAVNISKVFEIDVTLSDHFHLVFERTIYVDLHREKRFFHKHLFTDSTSKVLVNPIPITQFHAIE